VAVRDSAEHAGDEPATGEGGGPLERIAELDHTALALVEGLPPDQRDAIRARVIEEREYADIAKDLRCSEAVVRKRVSRALGTLKTQLEER
jgi:RNA polymerase sigma-70 factor (ECF subfamily)